MNKVVLSLTKLYLRSRKARFVNLSRIKLPDNREIEFIIYTSDNDFLLGQATVTGAIIVHEKCLGTQELLNYVVAHEDAHKKSWYSYLAIPLIIVFWFYGLFAVGTSLLYLGVMICEIDHRNQFY